MTVCINGIIIQKDPLLKTLIGIFCFGYFFIFWFDFWWKKALWKLIIGSAILGMAIFNYMLVYWLFKQDMCVSGVVNGPCHTVSAGLRTVTILSIFFGDVIGGL